MSRVVVGIDGSSAADEALVVALEEARLRGAELTVVSAWTHRLAALVPSRGRGPGPSALEAHALEAIWRSLKAAGASATDAVARPLQMPAGPALVEASRDAELLVVGARGGGARDLLLGSTTEHCVQRAACPVLV